MYVKIKIIGIASPTLNNYYINIINVNYYSVKLLKARRKSTISEKNALYAMCSDLFD